jgi:dipeptide/tripeptide permease
MILALILFVFGDRYYRIVPPTGEFVPFTVLKVIFTSLRAKMTASEEVKGTIKHWLDYSRPTYGSFVDEVRDLLGVITVLIPIPIYQALYNQKDSTWQQQLDQMNMKILPESVNNGFMPVEAFGNINPLMVIAFGPLFASYLYPALERRGIKFGSVERMLAGYFIGILSFIIMAFVQIGVDKSYNPEDKCASCLSAWWQTPQYVVITVSEVLVMISGLEFCKLSVVRPFQRRELTLHL